MIQTKIKLVDLVSWDGWALYINGKLSCYDNGNPDAGRILRALAAEGIIEFETGKIDDDPPETIE